jgi:putative protease
LCILVRSLDQLDAALGARLPAPTGAPAMIYCDFEDVRRYRDAVARAREAGVRIAPATLRIQKPGEEGLLRQIAACRPDAVLIRNLASLSWFREHAPDLPLVGDYALNIANELTASLFASEGLVRMTPGYDLTWPQLEAMLRRIDPAWFEVVVHQRMPMFHMEHCVYANVLSEGRDFRDCGRPCDRHRIALRDRAGAVHPVGVDVGCRNTVYNAIPQSAAEFIPAMLKSGLRHFRIELLHESAQETLDLMDAYARVIAGLDDGRAAWRRLKAVNQMGVTRGTMAPVDV